MTTPMYLTWLDNNSWLLELGNKRILVDPWLVGSLTFGNINWLFKGTRYHDRPIPERIDLILLSQGLADHTHLPTLEQLDRSIPIVASPSAAKVVQGLGYHQVITLNHDETFDLGNQIAIRALPGSPIGPFVTENAYLLKDIASGLTFYYEPHGYHAPVLKELGPIDVVLTPVIDMKLPVVGSIIQGKDSALTLARWVHPQVIVPTADPGDANFTGILMAAIRTTGTIEELRFKLAANHLTTKVLKPQPGDRLDLQLKPHNVTTA